MEDKAVSMHVTERLSMTNKMNENKNKIQGTSENWENGLLGNEEEFAKLAADLTSNDLDDMLALQMISIRLPKGLINDLKLIAKQYKYGGYQPFIRKHLEKLVVAEMKHMARLASQEAGDSVGVEKQYDSNCIKTACA